MAGAWSLHRWKQPFPARSPAGYGHRHLCLLNPAEVLYPQTRESHRARGVVLPSYRAVACRRTGPLQHNLFGYDRERRGIGFSCPSLGSSVSSGVRYIMDTVSGCASLPHGSHPFTFPQYFCVLEAFASHLLLYSTGITLEYV